MKTVLALTALGLLSFAAFSCRDTSPLPDAEPPEVRVAPPVEIVIPLVELKEEPAPLEKAVLQENLRKHLGGERIRPAEAKVTITPVPDYRLYSRAGPWRQVQKAAPVAKRD